MKNNGNWLILGQYFGDTNNKDIRGTIVIRRRSYESLDRARGTLLAIRMLLVICHSGSICSKLFRGTPQLKDGVQGYATAQGCSRMVFRGTTQLKDVQG